jgi:hypothetical protein
MTNKPTHEDKRAAVNIGVNLSNQLITTSLAIIAILGVSVTFLIQQKDVGFWFYFFSIISFFSLLASVFSGGKGINSARNNGYKGNWIIKEDKRKWFDWQAKFTLLGILSFCFIFFTGVEKKTELERSQIETNELLIKQINLTDRLMDSLIREQNKKIEFLEKKINEIDVCLKTKNKKK